MRRGLVVAAKALHDTCAVHLCHIVFKIYLSMLIKLCLLLLLARNRSFDIDAAMSSVNVTFGLVCPLVLL